MQHPAIQQLEPDTPLYVVADGIWRRSRHEEPTAQFGDTLSPEKAYNRALRELELSLEFPGGLIEESILAVLQDEVRSPFAGLEGTYVGLTPTDESAVGLGEIQLTISPFGLDIAVATGLMVVPISTLYSQYGEMPIVELDEAGVNNLFKQAQRPGDTLRLFTIDKNPWILFVTNRDDPSLNCARMFMGELVELMGATVLATPEQVKDGAFEELVKAIEDQHGEGVVPRISTGGLAPRNYKGELQD